MPSLGDMHHVFAPVPSTSNVYTPYLVGTDWGAQVQHSIVIVTPVDQEPLHHSLCVLLNHVTHVRITSIRLNSKPHFRGLPGVSEGCPTLFMRASAHATTHVCCARAHVSTRRSSSHYNLQNTSVRCAYWNHCTSIMPLETCADDFTTTAGTTIPNHFLVQFFARKHFHAYN
eukprot:m.41149 g.41149  ORF g.41149 m.41149 type:complete len:172 (-) comp14896_c0_seq4:449-964(-)